MKLWIVVFFLLPIIGMCYAAWRIWWILPASILVKIIAVLLLTAGFFGLIFYLRAGLDSFSRPMAIALYESITTWPVVLLYLVIVFLVLDLGRIAGLVPHEWMFHSMKGTLVIATFITVLMLYGNWNYRQKIRQPIDISTEKKLKKPLKIVMLSDLHLGYHNRRAELSRWIDILNNEHADLILIGGDIIDISVKPLIDENMAEEWHRLNAPVYACLGNHEYYAQSKRAQQFYSDANIHLLRDTIATFAGIDIVGRDDRTNPNRKPLAQIMNQHQSGNYTILIDHQPYNLEEAEQSDIDFQFSGHTHYGQVWPISWVEDLMYEKAFGPYQRGNTHYYISSGIGIWGAKIRIGTRSEYIVMNLHAK